MSEILNRDNELELYKGLLEAEQADNRALNTRINELWRRNVIMQNALEKITGKDSIQA